MVYRIAVLIAAMMLPLTAGGVPDTGVTPLKAQNFSELPALISVADGLGQFRARGPFTFTADNNREFRMSPKERIQVDLYLSSPLAKAPLVIFMHGLDSSKEDHAYQAMHLASWGIHSMAVQLRAQGPWITNGRTLARVVSLIRKQPALLDSRIDVTRIVLVGHSYGATAVAVALAVGAPASGAILLDPAVVERNVPDFLRKIRVPVMVLGADEQVSWTRNRSYFYRFIPKGVTELSIRDATHEDAQFPSSSSRATEQMQVTFLTALTSAAVSLTTTGRLDNAWTSYGQVLKNGQFFNAKRK